MTEEQARLLAGILSTVIAAASIAGMVGAWRIMRDVRDDNRRYQAEALQRMDGAMWAAEVDAAREAPGEA